MTHWDYVTEFIVCCDVTFCLKVCFHPHMICVSFQYSRRCHNPRWICSFVLVCLGKSRSHDLCYRQHGAQSNDVIDQRIVLSSWGQLFNEQKSRFSRNTVVFVWIGFLIMSNVEFFRFIGHGIEMWVTLWYYKSYAVLEPALFLGAIPLTLKLCKLKYQIENTPHGNMPVAEKLPYIAEKFLHSHKVVYWLHWKRHIS